MKEKRSEEKTCRKIITIFSIRPLFRENERGENIKIVTLFIKKIKKIDKK